MKPFFLTATPNFYFGISALVGIPGVCDLINGGAFGDIEAVIQGITGSVVASYLLYCALAIDRGNVALLDTRKVQRIGYAVLAVFAAGFLFDISTTLRLAL